MARMLRLFVLLQAGALSLLVAPDPSAARQPAIGALIVEVSARDGTKLAGATVSVAPKGSSDVPLDVTGTNGRVRFDDLPLGDFDVTISLDGFHSKRIRGTLKAGDERVIRTELGLATTTEELLVTAESPFLESPNKGLEVGGFVQVAELRDAAVSSSFKQPDAHSPFGTTMADPIAGHNDLAVVGGDHQTYRGSEGAYFELSDRGFAKGGGLVFPLIDAFKPAFFFGEIEPDGGFGTSRGTAPVSTFDSDFAEAVTMASGDYFYFIDLGLSAFRRYEAREEGLAFDGTSVMPKAPVGPAFGGYSFQGTGTPLDDMDFAAGGAILQDRFWIWGTYSQDGVQDLPAEGGCDPFTKRAETRITGYENDAIVSDHQGWEVNGTFGVGDCGFLGLTDGVRYGDSFALLAPKDGELYFGTKDLTNDEPPCVLSLGALPEEMDGKLFRYGSLGDPRSGDLIFEVPGGWIWEFSEDAHRLGFDPWPLSGRRPPLALDAPVQPLARTVTADRQSLRVGLYDTAQQLHGPADGLAGPVGAGSSSAVPSARVAAIVEPGCLDTDEALCLHDNRFAVSGWFQTPQGEQGRAHARPLADGSGTFWFFEEGNRELIAKVIDACAFGGHYWFFVAGLTNVGVDLEIWDTLTGRAGAYHSPVGTPFAPLLDTRAIPCQGGAVGLRDRVARARSAGRPPVEVVQPVQRTDGTACGGAPEDLCLADGRFRVEASWRAANGDSGAAFGGNLAPDTGALFFFDPSNVELLVKVLDVCSFADRFWVFAAGSTNVEVALTVVDTATGARRDYTNPLNTPFQPIQDTDAFATCP